MDYDKKQNVSVKITAALKEIKFDGKISNLSRFFEKEDVDKKIPLGKLRQILDLSYSVATLNDNELYVIAKNILMWQGAAKYLDPDVINSFENEDMKINSDVVDMGNKLEIKALQKGTNENPEWIGIMTYEEIVNADKNGLLRYNMNTQRVPGVFVLQGNIYYLPEIYIDSVNQIANEILADRFQTNTITLNILRKREPYRNLYDDENLLIINVDNNTKIDIIDGMHRVRGIVKAWQIRESEILAGKKKNQISGTMAVAVKNLTVEKAKKFIYQESLANKQSEKTTIMLNGKNILVDFINSINDNQKSNFYDKFVYYGEETDKIQIPISLMISLINDFSLTKDFSSKIKKLDDNAKLERAFVIFENGIFDGVELGEEYNNEMFYADILLYFLEATINKKVDYEDLDVLKKMTDEFIDKIKTNDAKSFNFEYPMRRVEKMRLKSFLSCNIE